MLLDGRSLSASADLRIRSLLLEYEFEELGICDSASRGVREGYWEGCCPWLAWQFVSCC